MGKEDIEFLAQLLTKAPVMVMDLFGTLKTGAQWLKIVFFKRKLREDRKNDQAMDEALQKVEDYQTELSDGLEQLRRHLLSADLSEECAAFGSRIIPMMQSGQWEDIEEEVSLATKKIRDHLDQQIAESRKYRPEISEANKAFEKARDAAHEEWLVQSESNEFSLEARKVDSLKSDLTAEFHQLRRKKKWFEIIDTMAEFEDKIQAVTEKRLAKSTSSEKSGD